jgi:acetyl-CoA carboxylase, biotin carboxylase subunit
MIRRLLIANRGEIAVRVIRACRELGIESVAIFSEADRLALHVREADFAVPVGPPPAAESYLNVERIVEAARGIGAQAVHPGYGFLAENARFARAVEDAGLIFVGPPSQAIAQMGDKVEARKLMAAAGVPVLPGSPGELESEKQVAEVAHEIGFPVILKAVAGGGGKGMRVVKEASAIGSALRAVTGEAGSSFGDSRFYVEKYLERPRHIEIQVLADRHGTTVHLFERECSIQRRHQKVVEESPSPFIDAATRNAMGEVAVRAARAVGYVSAGTIEFLADAKRNFYFIEMNTRMQVEHTVTEMVTGVDLVKAQIQIASGVPLQFRQEEIEQRGWALECRIYAEDPAQGFVPAPGRIDALSLPQGPGIRNDAGVYPGCEVPVHYDPIISKLVAWGRDRGEAIERMRRALGEFIISGTLATNLDFHRWLMGQPRFQAGDFDTAFIEEEYHPAALQVLEDPARTAAIIAAAIAARIDAHAAGAVAPAAPSAPRPALWKTLGRLELLKG